MTDLFPLFCYFSTIWMLFVTTLSYCERGSSIINFTGLIRWSTRIFLPAGRFRQNIFASFQSFRKLFCYQQNLKIRMFNYELSSKALTDTSGPGKLMNASSVEKRIMNAIIKPKARQTYATENSNIIRVTFLKFRLQNCILF